MAQIEHQVFEDIQLRLEEEAAVKDIVRELDRATRIQIANLNRVHANPTGPVPEVDFNVLREQLQKLDKLVPESQYYKCESTYCDIWRNTLQVDDSSTYCENTYLAY
ncbi:hypothetical protein NQZ79_g4578 [Umbelopsis isabellina]|nr:hypothetical protein NQZ79_g4578 [Umbelopsis isabellina]